MSMSEICLGEFVLPAWGWAMAPTSQSGGVAHDVLVMLLWRPIRLAILGGGTCRTLFFQRRRGGGSHESPEHSDSHV
jgi:hypothetical protein